VVRFVSVTYIKIQKNWVVKGVDKEEEAIKLIAADPEKYLDSQSVTRTEYKRPQQQSGNGWIKATKDQLLGTNSQR
jgi:hypothetical protein